MSEKLYKGFSIASAVFAIMLIITLIVSFTTTVPQIIQLPINLGFFITTVVKLVFQHKRIQEKERGENNGSNQ